MSQKVYSAKIKTGFHPQETFNTVPASKISETGIAEHGGCIQVPKLSFALLVIFIFTRCDLDRLTSGTCP